MPNAERQPTSAEIERGVAYMAYVVETYGERYAPILDSLIADLEIARRREMMREHWRRLRNRVEGRSHR